MFFRDFTVPKNNFQLYSHVQTFSNLDSFIDPMGYDPEISSAVVNIPELHIYCCNLQHSIMKQVADVRYKHQQDIITYIS